MRSIWRACSTWHLTGIAAAVILGAALAAPAGAVYWYDDWSDATDSNPPLDWTHSVILSGSYDASSGNYVLAGADLQEGITGGAISNDDEILAPAATGGDQYLEFTDNVSARTRVRINDFGYVGVSAFGNIASNDPAELKGYGVEINHNGDLYLSAFHFTELGEYTLLNTEPNTPLPELISDVYVQLDSNGTDISITAWLPGEPQPAAVSLTTQIPQAIRDIVPTVGPVGLVFNEDPELLDPNDPNSGSEGSATFFWAMASDIKLTNGDLNIDGVVNEADVPLFIDALLNGPYHPLADMNSDDQVNGLDIAGFVALAGGGGGSTQLIPEPSSLLLVGVVVLGLGALRWRRRGPP